MENNNDALYRRTWQDIKDSSGIDNKNVIKQLASKNFDFFLNHVLGLNTDSQFIQDAIDAIQNPPEQPKNKATKLAWMAPRGHSKTMTCTIGQSLWRVYSESGIEIDLMSASKNQSKDVLEKIKKFITRNDMLKHLRPEKERVEEDPHVEIDKWQADWSKEFITTTTDCKIVIKPFSSGIRGDHIDYLLADDLLADDSSGSRGVKQEKDIFYSAVSPIVENNEGLLQVVGTPRSHDGLLMELVEKDNYHSKKYQAIDEDGNVLWPYLWTEEQLEEKRKEIGPARFAREYLCNPVSEDEQFFHYQDIVKPAMDDKMGEQHWKANINRDIYEDWSFYCGVDIAMASGDNAAYTAFSIIGVDPEGIKWLIDQRRKKGMSPEKIADMLNDIDEEYGLSKTLVERNAIGMGVWKTIEDVSRLSGRVKPFDTTRKTRPEILSELQAALNRRELVIHDHPPLIEEFRTFRMKNGKLKGAETDDLVMSLAIALRAIEQVGQASATILVDGKEMEFDKEDRQSEEAEAMHGIV